MAKKPSLPVAKAGGGKPDAKVAVSTSDKIHMDKYAEEERLYRAASDARALADAEAIRRDKSRMKEVKNHVKLITKACK